jgi:hypothetical protein
VKDYLPFSPELVEHELGQFLKPEPQRSIEVPSSFSQESVYHVSSIRPHG